MGRLSNRIGYTIGINSSSWGIAREGKDVRAKPREEMFIWGREEGGGRVSFIECRIGRGVAFGWDIKD